MFPVPATSNYEFEYLNLLANTVRYGDHRSDRTGVGTLSRFGGSISANLLEGFPILTTKSVPFKAVLSELLWFVEGSGDERRLCEILHGTRDRAKKTIWTPNAEHTTGSLYTPEYYGDLGRVYGVQWRSWRTFERVTETDDDNVKHELPFFQLGKPVDQLAEVIHKIKTNPTDRRIIMTAWNPGELKDMVLPPCHMFAQFYVDAYDQLSCQVYMRSIDIFLGLPFNVASYALLTHMIAYVTGKIAHKVTIVFGDAHVYMNHIEQADIQLDREPRELPWLMLKNGAETINDFTMDSFSLEGYDPHPAIKAPMAA